MSKSKQQKQQEAIERKRLSFKYEIQHWIRCQPGGDHYEAALKHSKQAAQTVASDAECDLTRSAREAQVDRYGNPL